MPKRKNDVSKIQSLLRRKSTRLSIVSPNPKDENRIYYEECVHMIKEGKIDACMFNFNQVICIRNLMPVPVPVKLMFCLRCHG